ncbi:MAG: long-chain fatty acid--CoA ligase [Vicinamibacterales bacterium]
MSTVALASPLPPSIPVALRAAIAPRSLADLAWWPLLKYPETWSIGRCRDGRVDALSADEWALRVRELVAALAALGLKSGDRVAILSETRPEWVLADLAVLSLGGITVPIYPTLPPHQVQYILNDSGARFLVASDLTQVDKVQQARHLVPAVEVIVVMDAGTTPDGAIAMPASSIGFDELCARGRERLRDGRGEADAYWTSLGQLEVERTATIIYTSGTSGDPKGVMLSHRNLLSNIDASGQALEFGATDSALSFLPLSHSFERMVVFTYMRFGVRVAFAENLDTLGRDLQTVRPTLMTGVPRVYEKLQARIMAGLPPGGLKPRLFSWALQVGRGRAHALAQGHAPSPLIAAQHWLADRLVGRAIRARLGGRLRFVVSGSAPLPREVGEFFQAIGLTIVEGYGLTETSPVLTTNPDARPRFGTVGRPVPGVEIRIADDGEILARGPNVMQGYYGRPDETASVIVDGWFHTGDIGEMSDDGFLRITDRKKDLIVTSGGKNVAPQPIEAQMKRSPLVAEAVAIGDGRRFLSMLIVPSFDVLGQRLEALGRPSGTRDELVARPDVLGLYQELIDGVNRGLAQFERIKRVALLPADFTIATGELTPTLKVRRRVVEARAREVIDSLYRDE